jgi:hypothetical protein
MKRTIQLFLVLALVAGFSASAQRFTRVLRDVSGNPVTGATVKLYTAGTSTFKYTLTEDGTAPGTYYKDDVLPGYYDVYVNNIKKQSNIYHADQIRIGGRWDDGAGGITATLGGTKYFAIQGNHEKGWNVDSVFTRGDTTIVQLGPELEGTLEWFDDIGIGGAISVLTDTAGMFQYDEFQVTLGGWSGDTLRMRLVEWMRPTDFAHPSIVFDTSTLGGIYKSLATCLTGYKKFYVYGALKANTPVYMTAIADTANGFSIHSITYDTDIITASLDADQRLSRYAGGIRMETGDTEFANTSVWVQSTAPAIAFEQVDAANYANGLKYPLNKSLNRYEVGQFPFRISPSTGSRIFSGYVWVWYSKDKSVATPSTFDAYIQHNP